MKRIIAWLIVLTLMIGAVYYYAITVLIGLSRFGGR